MLSLIKYEWMSRWKFFLAGLVVCILFNINLVTNIINKENSVPKLTIMLGVILFAMGVVFAFDHITRMYKSLFMEQGQFLFTTPLSGYKILGSKIINIVLECVGIFLLGLSTGVVDYQIIMKKVSKEEVHFFRVNENFLWEIMRVFIVVLLSYIVFLLIVYLSMALSKSILSAIKYGKLLSFGLFIFITQMIGKAVGWIDSSKTYFSIEESTELFTSVCMLHIGIIGILFIATGYLLDRKINL